MHSYKPNEVSNEFQAGILALRCYDDTRRITNVVKVQLSIDPKGFYLICRYSDKADTECFDLIMIHDTRTSGNVNIPQGAENYEQLRIGTLGTTLAARWLTIYYGNTYISSDLYPIHFAFESMAEAEKWQKQLFNYSRNIYIRNLSCFDSLQKLYSRIYYGLINLETKEIPVKNLVKLLCKNVSDPNKERVILKTLDELKFPNKKPLNADHFTFNSFLRLYKRLIEGHEIDELFKSLMTDEKSTIEWKNLTAFMKQQNEDNDEILTSDDFEQKVETLIEKHSKWQRDVRVTGMSASMFLEYLLSSDNSIISSKRFSLSMDMDQPLTHYFISSSHNSYIAGNQIIGRASIEMYRLILLTGCRCIELDILDSENGEPVIKHKATPMSPVPFVDVIAVIRDYAFKVTSYPLILSFENHCGVSAQNKMVQYLVDMLGDYLLTKPLEDYPCIEGKQLPSPNSLKNKILIKNKKYTEAKLTPNSNRHYGKSKKNGTLSTKSSSDTSTDAESSHSQNSVFYFPPVVPESNATRISRPNNRIHGLSDLKDFESSDDENLNEKQAETPTIANDCLSESKPIQSLSDLVIYVVPVKFRSFEYARQRNRYYEMSSFPEEKGISLRRDQAQAFLLYNTRQFSRIFPRGTRFSSTNFMPYQFWELGCQMVALNYQTLDVPMQLNFGLFSFNNACGYIKKPNVLCQDKISFDPKTPTSIENVVSYDIQIKVISGQFFCQDRKPAFIDVQLHGSYSVTDKQPMYRICATSWNGFQATYDNKVSDLNECTIQFSKIILPELAALRFVVSTDDLSFLGQCFIPVEYLRSGYRHVVLKNQINLPVQPSTLFVYVKKTVALNVGAKSIADQLINPSVGPLERGILTKSSSSSTNEANNLMKNSHVRFHRATSDTSSDASCSNSLSELNEKCPYYKHIICSSEFNSDCTYHLTPLNVIELRDKEKCKQLIGEKLRTTSLVYDHQISEKMETIRRMRHSNSTESAKQCPLTPEECQKRKQQLDLCQEELLGLLSKKLHEQEGWECNLLNEYFNRVEAQAKKDYEEKLAKLNAILEEDNRKVAVDVEKYSKSEKEQLKKRDSKSKEIKDLKQNITKTHEAYGELIGVELKKMYENATERLRKNFQKHLEQIETRKIKEINNCLDKYHMLYSKEISHLSLQCNADEYYV